MATKRSLGAISEALFSSKKCLVVSHYNPDADAYGSSCGLVLALKAIGIDAVCVNQNGASPRYSFVHGMDSVLGGVPRGDWDTLVVCDCAGMDRIGESLLKEIPETPVLINIDHHISNDGFGTHVYVKPEASSTSELVFHILQKLSKSINKEVAENLMVGIYGDTGSFRYSCTGPETFRTMFRLCKYGASPYDVSSFLYSTVELSALKLQTTALSQVKLYCSGKIAEVVVTKDLFDSCGADLEDAEILAERARDIAGVEVSVSIREDGDIWRVSLRAKNSRYNMSEVASCFGGGGHLSAAAFRWRRSLEELEEELLQRLSDLLMCKEP
ncbi:MAG: bifunctional oligoribonuclease/PAP phosphatase NrnA [SAR324 cluster bacterium]|uniref:Bifunctional oligoribonuclease/PAP phosphatase NrnA n=1 Tax=SAR324 cluster bacterium TaxID=2024889 RepID=A0A7X9FV43_9DELT|nr:bifunctional oligoribonuclease/PAP phosphatase NrnA [SAR324 cluster bacterium]